MLQKKSSSTHRTVVLYLRKFIFIFTRFNLPEDFDLDSIVEKCPFTLTGADFYALSSDAMLNAVKRRIQELELGMNFLKNIFFWWGGGCIIYIFSVVALDETIISSRLHFSMQNIEMSCDLDPASGQSNVSSANNFLCLLRFA